MKFHKMHGLGNDFVVLNLLDAQEDIMPQTEAIRKVCCRKTGVGADGIVVVLPSAIADLRMQIFNADGSEASMCGNASRCFSQYVYQHELIHKRQFLIETLGGNIRSEIISNDKDIYHVKVMMGKPDLQYFKSSVLAKGNQIIDEVLVVDNIPFQVTSMYMNAPHSVIFTENLNKLDILKIGPKIAYHESFDSQTNVNFVQILSESEVKIKTWEIGVGIPMACGTGSCASLVAGVLQNKLNEEVLVKYEIGDLSISLDEYDNLYMQGPSTEVFSGDLSLELYPELAYEPV